MKKTISCKVIKTIPLGTTDSFCPYIVNKIIYPDTRITHTDQITYTNKMEVKKELDFNSAKSSINILA